MNWRRIASSSRLHRPVFRNLRSLGYIEQAVIEPWNETTGRDAEAFWRGVAEARLDYQRRDVVCEVLARNEIKDRVEHELVVDTLAATPMRRLAAGDVASLQRLVDAFQRTH